MPRKRKKPAAPAGRDTYHVMLGDVEVKVTGHGPKVCLLLAEEYLQRQAADETEVIVERRTLLGPAAPLYRVVRDEHGNVQAFTLDAQD